MTVRLKTVLALPALLLINILAGCNQDTPSGEQSAVPVIAASLESAAPGSVDSGTYSGTVKPHRQVDLAFRVSGYVKDLLNVRDASGDNVCGNRIALRPRPATHARCRRETLFLPE